MIKNYNELVDDRDTWKKTCGVLNIRLDQLKLDLKLERDRYKEEHEKVRQKYIDKDVELQIVDRIVLQYKQLINELEEQLSVCRR